MKVDWRALVRPPFGTCSACGQESLGRGLVNPSGYTLRCVSCGHSETFDLPPLHKTVLYLDQFALSEMMKALNPDTKAHQRGQVKPAWAELFEQLDRLAKLQLLVCPESEAHEDESQASPFFDSIRSVYELLSGGLRFFDRETITQSQLVAHAKDWLANNADGPLDLGSTHAIMGQPHAWTDTIRVAVRFDVQQHEVEAQRQTRDGAHDALVAVFSRWQAETTRRFEDWYEEELASFGPMIWKDYVGWQGRLQEVVSGARPPTLDNLSPPRGALHVQALQSVFSRAGVSPEVTLDKVREFLFSDTLGRVPVARIGALLYAGLAHQAATGRRRPPNRGTFTDVKTVSTLLPYCDAMLVDNETRTLLASGPVKRRLGFETLVFSTASLADFRKFLEGVEANASPEHLRLVREVYGEVSPYTSLFLDKKRRERRDSQPAEPAD